MKKRITAIVFAAAAALSLTGCKDKLKGGYELLSEDGEKLADIEFEDEDFKLKTEDDKFKGSFEIIENGKIKMKFKNDDMDDACGGKQKYELVDKKGIYIEDVSDKMEKLAEEAAREALNADARSLYLAMNSALADLEEDGVYVSGTYVISSDDSLSTDNDDVDSSYRKKLNERLKNYFEKLDDYSYVTSISYGYCECVFISENTKSKVVGVYPSYYEEEHSGETLKDIAKDLSK